MPGRHRPVAVHAKQLGGTVRQALEQALLADQYARMRVLQHIRQPGARIGRVQRHVGAAGLQDAQQRDNQVERTLQAHADQGFRGDADAAQMAGQLIGAPIQFGVAEFLPVERHGHTVRRARRLGFDHAVQRIQGIGARRVVPVQQQLIPLGVRQQRQVRHAHARLGYHRFQQARQMARHPLHRRRFEQVGAVLQYADQGVARVGHFQRQVELPLLLHQLVRFERKVFPFQPLAALRAGHEADEFVRLLRFLQHERGLKQRVAAAVPLQLQLFDEQGKRIVLMRQRAQYPLARLYQQLFERQRGGQVRAQHHRIDKIADHTGEVVLHAPGHGRADQDSFLVRIAIQQHLVSRQQQGVQRHAFGLGQRLNALRQLRRQAESPGGAAIRQLRRTRMVDRQRQRRQFAGQLPLPVGAQRRAARAGQHVLLAPHVVGVVQFQRREAGAFARVQFIQRAPLVQQHPQRPAVADDVVGR